MKKEYKIILIFILLISGISYLLVKEYQKTDIKETNKKQTSTSEVKQTEQPKRKSSNEEITDYVNQLSAEEKVGQLFLIRIPEENVLSDIEKYNPGGVVIFGRDVEKETKISFTDKINGFQKKSRIPLLVASDEEGGTVTRISPNRDIIATPFKSPQEIYKEDGLEGLKKDTKERSEKLKELGINVNLGPVADVSTEKESFIYDRSLGLPTDETSLAIAAMVSVMNEEKIGNSLKHFPGYGDNKDSHTEIVYDDRKAAELRKNDWLPFEVGIRAGADSILVSHNVLKDVDDKKPSSLSKPVHDILRNDLKFSGVIMTDDMDMAGLTDFTTQKEGALDAILSGNDLVMTSHYQEQIPFILEEMAKNEELKKRIDESVTRVIKWKYELGLLSFP
ncbi:MULTISPECIES: glycoside hydrolase family 3 N-terminal domain-containing protein [Vagococcus]|uniref:Beta-hexosaminidase n=1 Tax=Vagococcus fluvialis bH819 TaxID=1255619 RepID=A0A1X6WS74_9ENTE|nr:MULTISPECIES: glycoside hydrolase family 3 N-terminal domain-containing protein [Vagococcus]SLM87135.1 Beta-hexosaminidase [Vagococcus fluvialis bH819]HCM90052.1 beta-hexosaminidase [Vagococcus sp.]